MARLCEVCKAQNLCKFLHDAVNQKEVNDSGKDKVSLGRWSDLQARRDDCQLCDAAVTLLQDVITKRLASKYPIFQKTIKPDVITCGLQRHVPFAGHSSDSFTEGYALIDISVEVQKNTYTGHTLESFTMEGAFQASATVPLSPKTGIQKPVRLPLDGPSTMSPPEVRIVTNDYDSSLVRQWLDLCLRKHGGAYVSLEEPVSKIRLVDIQRQAIVEFPDSEEAEIPPYVALSWVWGSIKPQLGLTLDRIWKADTYGFLESLRLPSAVMDSLHLVEQLGVRF